MLLLVQGQKKFIGGGKKFTHGRQKATYGLVYTFNLDVVQKTTEILTKFSKVTE